MVKLDHQIKDFQSLEGLAYYKLALNNLSSPQCRLGGLGGVRQGAQQNSPAIRAVQMGRLLAGTKRLAAGNAGTPAKPRTGRWRW